jgi:hypothetical protein
MLKIKIAIGIKCKRHPRFDPERQGEADVKGGCMSCLRLLRICIYGHATQRQLETYAAEPGLELVGRK